MMFKPLPVLYLILGEPTWLEDSLLVNFLRKEVYQATIIYLLIFFPLFIISYSTLVVNLVFTPFQLYSC